MTPRVVRSLSARLEPWNRRAREDAVRRLTAISSSQWRELERIFPGLGRDAGRRAARARRRMQALSSHALESGRWDPPGAAESPDRTPTVYVTAHIGSIQLLRYVLRARGVAAAAVLAPYNFDRPGAARDDERFDRRFPIPFPHVLSSAAPHRLRRALKTGSLIAAADLPAREGIDTPLLGGSVRLDPRPFRLARLAGRPCRAAFLTLPARLWRLTLGPELPSDPDAAMRSFAGLYQEVAGAAPLDLDGLFYWNLSRGPA